MGASLYEYRDLDLLLKLQAEGNEDGWVESAELAEAVGLGDNGGAHAIAQRLSWMRRYGMLEFDQDRRLWRVTEGGERVTKARLKAAHSKTIEALPDESMVEVMAAVTTRYVHGSSMMAHMLRREFMYGTQPGRRR